MEIVGEGPPKQRGRLPKRRRWRRRTLGQRACPALNSAGPCGTGGALAAAEVAVEVKGEAVLDDVVVRWQRRPVGDVWAASPVAAVGRGRPFLVPAPGAPTRAPRPGDPSKHPSLTASLRTRGFVKLGPMFQLLKVRPSLFSRDVTDNSASRREVSLNAQPPQEWLLAKSTSPKIIDETPE